MTRQPSLSLLFFFSSDTITAILIIYEVVVVLFLSRVSTFAAPLYLQHDGRVCNSQPLCLIHQPLLPSIVHGVMTEGIRLECRVVSYDLEYAPSISLTLLWELSCPFFPS